MGSTHVPVVCGGWCVLWFGVRCAAERGFSGVHLGTGNGGLRGNRPAGSIEIRYRVQSPHAFLLHVVHRITTPCNSAGNAWLPVRSFIRYLHVASTNGKRDLLLAFACAGPLTVLRCCLSAECRPSLHNATYSRGPNWSAGAPRPHDHMHAEAMHHTPTHCNYCRTQCPSPPSPSVQYMQVLCHVADPQRHEDKPHACTDGHQHPLMPQ